MFQHCEIYTFSLPGIAFGNKHVPILSLIQHSMELKIGSIPGKDENPFTIYMKPVYQINDIDGKLYLSINGNVRKSVEISKVFIVYRDYVPNYGLVRRRIRLLDDVDTLKIVSSVVFVKLYQLITGSKIEMRERGVFDSTDPKVVEFIVARRFLTPGILKIWNRDGNLKIYLPYKIWIAEES